MKQRIEQTILIAIALVSGAAPFLLAPRTEGLVLASLHIALAFVR